MPEDADTLFINATSKDISKILVSTVTGSRWGGCSCKCKPTLLAAQRLCVGKLLSRPGGKLPVG